MTENKKKISNPKEKRKKNNNIQSPDPKNKRSSQRIKDNISKVASNLNAGNDK